MEFVGQGSCCPTRISDEAVRHNELDRELHQTEYGIAITERLVAGPDVASAVHVALHKLNNAWKSFTFVNRALRTV